MKGRVAASGVARYGDRESIKEPDGKVLVVDDNEQIGELLRRRLTRWGYDARSATTAERALELTQADPPDIIVSDWQMPGMTGADLCQALRADPRLRGIFFIMLTGKRGPDERVATLLGGADEVILKPWDDRELLARIRNGIRLVTLRRELETRAKSEVMAHLAVTMAHEILNPLTGLLAELQLIEMDEELSTRGAEGLARASALAQRIATTVKRLRELDPEMTKPYAHGVKMFDVG